MEFDKSDVVPLSFLVGVMFSGIILLDLNLIISCFGTFLFYSLFNLIYNKIKERKKW